MAADPIVSCLANLTDYLQFERLCHDLMALEDYPSIEPLGGFKDKGRDAVHVCEVSGQVSIFCCSVREDWRAKLEEDAKKIQDHKHPCNKLVYLSTQDFTPNERDKAIAFIKKKYGWALELYGRERLRTLLTNRHRHLIAHHPHIFTPAYFIDPLGAGSQGGCDTLFLSYAQADAALATWLARRLIAEGYRVWCEDFSLLAGQPRQQTIERVIQTRAIRVLALYSPASLENADVHFQRTLAHTIGGQRGGDFLIPLAAEPVPEDRLDWKTKTLSFVRFDQGWATGLRDLLKKLVAIETPKPVGDGRGVAMATLLRADLLTPGPERLISNCLEVEKIPSAVHRFVTKHEVSSEALEALRWRWAFRVVSPNRFLSFHQPPEADGMALGLTAKGGVDPRHSWDVDGCSTVHLISELVRKSLIVKSIKRGLRASPEKGHLYFPDGLLPNNRLNLTRPDGQRTWTNSVGQRTYWQPQKSEEYCYFLSPTFEVSRAHGGSLVVLVRPRVYLTDLQGNPLVGRKIASRRKHLCKSWWNDAWLNRMLAVCQFLADGGDTITIGDVPEEQVVIHATPRGWDIPFGINEELLEKGTAEREDAVLPHDPEAFEEEESDDDHDA